MEQANFRGLCLSFLLITSDVTDAPRPLHTPLSRELFCLHDISLLDHQQSFSYLSTHTSCNVADLGGVPTQHETRFLGNPHPKISSASDHCGRGTSCKPPPKEQEVDKQHMFFTLFTWLWRQVPLASCGRLEHSCLVSLTARIGTRPNTFASSESSSHPRFQNPAQRFNSRASLTFSSCPLLRP